MKPRILLTSRPSQDAFPAGESPFREYVYQSYTDALRHHGAIVTIVPISNPEDVGVLLSAVDGLVVAGGRDLNPKTYGQEREAHTQEPHDALDTSDLALLRHAREINLPTLGICRGMQALNVMSGGTLNQNIAGERPHHPTLAETFAESSSYRHMVTLDADSWIAKTYASTRLETNSIHHQCVEEIGDGLKVVGRADDGTVEAIESVTDWFAVGTQWHPELLSNPEVIFGAFVQGVLDYRITHDRREEVPTS
jgi:putative glutamine amidotransferase